MRDIVVVGSLNLDVSVQATHIPRPGETVRAAGLSIGPGGKGLNQAIAASRLGARVHMVGQLGDDRFAEVPEAALRDAGVDTSYVRRLPGWHTGTALIVVDETSGENAIAVAAGANRALSPQHVQDAVAAFRGSGVLMVQLELPLETVETALDLAKENALVTLLDPAPARELPDTVLRKIDVLTPNETEAEFLTGIRVRDPESAAKAGARLRERTLSDVLVTLGAAGCVWVWSTGFEHIPAPRVEAVDTTAAGDAFNAGLAVGLARGEPIARALRTAVRAGAAATLRSGAAAAMPTAEDLAALPEAG
jgi:ribokinase